MAAPKIAIVAGKVLPSPKGLPLIGTLGALIAAGGAQNLHKYVDARHKELGPIYKEKIGPVTGVFVSSADYMRRIFALEGKYPAHIIPESWVIYNQIYGQKRGLLFMEGEEWYKYRKILNNVILKPETDAISRAVTVAAEDLVSQWCKDEKTTDLEHQLYRWSLQSIVAIMMGSEKFAASIEETRPMINQLANGLHRIFEESGKLSLLPAKMAQQLKLPVWRRFAKAVESSFNTAGILMETMKRIEPDATGLLGQLTKTNMSNTDLIRIVLDLILAAGDTTSYTTQWLLYQLAEEPEFQQQLYEEISKTNDNALLRAVLRETLRMYPVAPFVTRYMPNDVEIDGYQLNKGDLVIMSLYTSGRDGDSFPQPDKFIPHRWLREEGGYNGVKNPYASLPFAMGARSCIGKKIAETQITTTVALIVKKLRISRLTKTPVEIKLNMIAVPSVPIELKLLRRAY